MSKISTVIITLNEEKNLERCLIAAKKVSDEIVFLLEGKIYFKGSISELKTKTNQPDFEHAIASILTNNHA